MKQLKRLVLVLFHFTWLFMLLGLIWAAWYLNTVGLSKKWRTLAVEEFRKNGVEVEIGRITLDPFRGLIAKDVRVADPRDPGQTLAAISHVGLDINYANLLRRQTFLNSVDVRDARLSVPIDPATTKSARVKISGFSAKIFFHPGRIDLSQAAFELYGIRVRAAGSILTPGVYPPREKPPDPEAAARRNALIERILAEAGELRYTAAAPTLEIHFSGNAADPDSFHVSRALLRAEGIIRKNISLPRLEADVSFHDGRLRLHRLLLADKAGELLAEGKYDVPNKTGSARLHSAIALPELVDEFLERDLLTDVTFQEPPALDLEIEMQPDGKFLCQGRVRLRKFAFRGAEFNSLSASFAWDGTRAFIDDLLMKHPTGDVRASVLRDPQRTRIDLESDISPAAFATLLEGKVAQMMSEWDFRGSTIVDVQGEGPTDNPALFTLDGALRITDASFRDVSFLSLASAVHMSERQITYSDVHLQRAEGQASGTFVYDFGRGEARLAGVKMNLHPPDVATWVDARLVRDIAPYRTRGVPFVELDGTVKIGPGNANQLLVKVHSPEGMFYNFAGKDLPLENVRGELHFNGPRLKLHDARARLFGGDVSVEADISIVRENPGHTARIEADGVDFESLTRLYFDYADSKGRMSGDYAYRMGDGPREMTGSGRVQVVQGNVFAIPVLGPFSGILNNLVPGMGFTIARKAEATFTIDRGVIHTDDFEVEGQGFSLYGQGDLFFLDDRMDFSVRINARGMPGVLLFPVSKLLEYVADEKLTRPNWRPKNLPRRAR